MVKTTVLPLLWLAIGSSGLAQDTPRSDAEATSRRDTSAPSDTDKKQDLLAMTKGVACRSVDGFEKYEPLPGGALTSDEKLQIYYRPLNYRTVSEGGEYRVHLTQDGQIRRQGEKVVQRSKKNILVYAPKSREPLGTIFLRNSVPLKGLTPGDYEYDIILRDENGSGPPAVQSVKFKIVQAEMPAGKSQKKSRTRKGPARSRNSDPDQWEGVFPPEIFMDPDERAWRTGASPGVPGDATASDPGECGTVRKTSIC
jgi:hypothetical protein